MLKVMLNQNRILCIKAAGCGGSGQTECQPWNRKLWNWVLPRKFTQGVTRGCNPDYVWKIVYHQTACASFILLQRSLIRTAKHPWYNQLSMYTHLPGKNRTEQLSCLLAKVRMSIFPKGQTCMLKKYKNHFESTNLHQGSWLSLYF